MTAPVLVRVDTSCDEWGKSRFPKGYGQQHAVRFGKQLHYAHVVAWVDAHGRLPDPGMQINHHCDNPPCVEPSHLYEGTQRDNMQDKVARGRHSEQQSDTFHCGCPKTEANSRWIFDKRRGKPGRSCLFHARKNAREYQRAKRGVTTVKVYHHNGQVIGDADHA